MQCKQCKKTTYVVINNKRFCAHCGNEHASPIKKTAHNKNVLDLSNLRAKPARSVHGVAKPTLHNKPPHIGGSSSKPVTKQPSSARLVDTPTRSPLISKFGNIHSRVSTGTSQSEAITTIKAVAATAITHMSPHHTYQLTAQPSIESVGHSQSTAKTASSKKITQRSKRKLLIRTIKIFTANPRITGITAVSLSAVVLAIYIGYLAYPNLALRIAASRSGLEVRMPRYVPNGYSFRGPIVYSPGALTIRFTSNADSGFITLAQQNTVWDSASLLENYVKTKTDNYITFQKSGLTIYVYNGNSAAWVNNGVWYTLEGNNYLNGEQIIQIASSVQS